MRIGADRYVIPGDYVVHSEGYGVGKYLGIRNITINPRQPVHMHIFAQALIVQYCDAEVVWYSKFAESSLHFFRTKEAAAAIKVSVDSVLDRRKWQRKLAQARERTRREVYHLVSLMAVRNEMHRTPCLPDDDRYRSFEDNFPYTPTADQLQGFQSIAQDMINSTRPMNRLICGDVGFGKTEVAMRAMYRAALNGKQAVLLAPTTVLAQQHMQSLRVRMPDINVRLMQGGYSKDKASIMEELANGSCQVVVGTHALLQPKVQFHNLGLLVVDEEQRFGVAHKERLKSTFDRLHIDLLTMSATPIPRTLEMAFTGLKDINTINSPPKDRLPVITVLHEMQHFHNLRSIIELELARDGQVFVIVPWVKQINDCVEMLRLLLPALRIRTAHGHMEGLEKTIENFLHKDGDVLVATTVLEIGIDMPNVNTIVVLNAERFGISTLHQLRGRVGRSSRQAYAYFFTMINSLEQVVPQTPELLKLHSEVQKLQQVKRIRLGRSPAVSAPKVGKRRRSGQVQETPLDVDAEELAKTVKREALFPVSETNCTNQFLDAAYVKPGSLALGDKSKARLEYIRVFTALGSGYDLALRDKDMRGHGDVFGFNQTGKAKAGLGDDIQQYMLKEELSRISQGLILSVADSRVRLDNGLEATIAIPFLGEIPPSDDLAQLSLYESRLLDIVVNDFCQQHQKTDFRQLATKVMNARSGKDLLDVCYAYSIKEDEPIWQLLLRNRLRIAGRQLSILEIDLAENAPFEDHAHTDNDSRPAAHFVLHSTSLTPAKLRGLEARMDKVSSYALLGVYLSDDD